MLIPCFYFKNINNQHYEKNNFIICYVFISPGCSTDSGLGEFF